MRQRARLYFQLLKEDLQRKLHEATFGPSNSAPCKCGCPYSTHTHNRPGHDCGKCGDNKCPRYRHARGSLRLIRS